MARKHKTGFRYFPLYHELFTGKKMQAAEDAIDPTGDDIAARILVDKFLVRIYSEIFKMGYFLFWNHDVKQKLCGEIGNGVTIIKLDRYVNAFFTAGFLNKELFEKYSILTNKGIQEEWLNISISYFRRKDAYIISEYNLITSEEMPITSEETIRSLGKKNKKIRKEAKKLNGAILPRITSEEMPITSEEMPITSEATPITSAFLFTDNFIKPISIYNTNNTEGINKKIHLEDEEGFSEEMPITSEVIGITSEVITDNSEKQEKSTIVTHKKTTKPPKNESMTENSGITSEEMKITSENKRIDLNGPPLNGFHDVEHLLEIYFTSNSMIRTREQVAMAMHMDENTLRDWGNSFNRYLISEGTTLKQREDWPKHFRRWLNLQNKNINPNTLFNEKSIENGKPESKPAAEHGNIKGHQPISWESIVSKANKLTGKNERPGS